MASVTEDVAKRARKFQSHYVFHKNMLENFFRTFEDPNYSDDLGGQASWNQLKYLARLQNVSNGKEKVVDIELDDLLHMKTLRTVEDPRNPNIETVISGEDVVEAIEFNVSRYLDIFTQVFHQMSPQSNAFASPQSHNSQEQIMYNWRLMRMEMGNDANQADPQCEIPVQLLQNFEIRIVPRKSVPKMPFRLIKSERCGRLVTFDGIVTRVGPVKPRLLVATYQCAACRTEIYQVCEGLQVTPLIECPTPQCKTNKVMGQLQMHLRTSKFMKYQELKVQEMAHEVPTGCVPQMLTLVTMGELTRACLPGDAITVSGVYLPIPVSGFAGIRKGLSMDMFVECHQVIRHKSGFTSSGPPVTLDDLLLKADPENVYERMAESLAPEIWGHTDVKKALLLLLMGGILNQREDGMRLRGDLHVLLMGDPGVAKSQLMKALSRMAPRAIYTNGRGTSGAGLTASVLRDPITQEATLEGGALVMADRGICCIDEFDKMEESDRTAIHEVMEQQTVSIAKAGITTTLNARCSILASANPVYGRYDPSKTPLKNINLPAALLSRFDLTFLLLDCPNVDNDLRLATHICMIHQNSRSYKADLGFEPLNDEFFRQWIAYAREYTPLVPESLKDDIVSKYAEMRATERQDRWDERKTYTTPRQLLSILRLAQAHARLRLRDEVDRKDFEEAIRLMTVCRDTVTPEASKEDAVDFQSAIWGFVSKSLLKQDLSDEEGWTAIIDLERMVLSKGFSHNQFDTTLKNYEAVGVVLFSSDNSRVILV